MIGSLAEWMQSTRIATAVGESTSLTAALSSIHVVGMTLLVGAVLVSSLTRLGVIFRDRPVVDVTAGTDRGVILGLFISVPTGLLLLGPRASAAFQNGIFQSKMLLLFLAAAFHFGLSRKMIGPAHARPGVLRLAGALALALWYGVAMAGALFILLE